MNITFKSTTIKSSRGLFHHLIENFIHSGLLLVIRIKELNLGNEHSIASKILALVALYRISIIINC